MAAQLAAAEGAQHRRCAHGHGSGRQAGRAEAQEPRGRHEEDHEGDREAAPARGQGAPHAHGRRAGRHAIRPATGRPDRSRRRSVARADSVAGLAVDRFADEVGVAAVAGVLLDHVDEDPPQRPRSAAVLHGRVEVVRCRRSRRGCVRPTRSRAGASSVGLSSAAESRSQSGVASQSTPDHGSMRPSPSQHSRNQPCSTKRHVLQQAADRERRGAESGGELGLVEPGRLAEQHGPVVVEELDQRPPFGAGGVRIVRRRSRSAIMAEFVTHRGDPCALVTVPRSELREYRPVSMRLRH